MMKKMKLMNKMIMTITVLGMMIDIILIHKEMKIIIIIYYLVVINKIIIILLTIIITDN